MDSSPKAERFVLFFLNAEEAAVGEHLSNSFAEF